MLITNYGLESSKLHMSLPMHPILVSAYSPNPFSSSAKRVFKFCVPDEWYRRSKSRKTSATSFEPSDSTIKRLASLQEAEDEDGDEGTAKLRGVASSETHQSAALTTDRRGLITQNSSSNWFRPVSPASPTRSVAFTGADIRKSVSEPIHLDLVAENGLANANSGEGLDDVDDADFERILV